MVIDPGFKSLIRVLRGKFTHGSPVTQSRMRLRRACGMAPAVTLRQVGQLSDVIGLAVNKLSTITQSNPQSRYSTGIREVDQVLTLVSWHLGTVVEKETSIATSCCLPQDLPQEQLRGSHCGSSRLTYLMSCNSRRYDLSYSLEVICCPRTYVIADAM